LSIVGKISNIFDSIVTSLLTQSDYMPVDNMMFLKWSHITIKITKVFQPQDSVIYGNGMENM